MNARVEFINHIGSKKVLCCEISILRSMRDYDSPYGNNDDHKFYDVHLTTGYSIDEWNDFLKSIDITYDNGYGSQELFGTIWYEDGTWSSRFEYDGSEGWVANICPKIPEILNRIDKVRDKKINSIL